jgi:hypothetical protein
MTGLVLVGCIWSELRGNGAGLARGGLALGVRWRRKAGPGRTGHRLRSAGRPARQSATGRYPEFMEKSYTSGPAAGCRRARPGWPFHPDQYLHRGAAYPIVVGNARVERRVRSHKSRLKRHPPGAMWPNVVPGCIHGARIGQKSFLSASVWHGWTKKRQ